MADRQDEGDLTDDLYGTALLAPQLTAVPALEPGASQKEPQPEAGASKDLRHYNLHMLSVVVSRIKFNIR